MENLNNEIFKTKIFYEFFMYCMKNRLKYNMDVSNKTHLNFNQKEKTITVIIPNDINEYNEKIIFDGWKDIINKIEPEENIIETLNFLENLSK